MQSLLKFYGISKAQDVVQEDGTVVHTITGVSTNEAEDGDHEKCLYLPSKPAYQKYAEQALRISTNAGMKPSLGGIRIMHSINLGIGGKISSMQFDDQNRQIEITVIPKDEEIWRQVLNGGFLGFSHAGGYAFRKCSVDHSDIQKAGNFCDRCQKNVVVEYAVDPLIEISLVDMPSNPDAIISSIKGLEAFPFYRSNGSVELRKYKTGSVSVAVPALPDLAKFSHGTVQIDIAPESVAGSTIKMLRDAVKYEHLAHEAGGREDSAHITVRYGIIPGSDTAAIQDFIAKQPPFEIELGPTDSFTPTANSDMSAPLYVSVISSDELNAINGGLKDAAPDSWKAADFDYHPHCTLAYVTSPDVANLYTKNAMASGLKYEVTEMSIRPNEGTPITVKLAGEKKQAAAKPPQEVKVEPKVKKAAKTKRKAGEDLTADAFLLVGDPQDPSTWSLPWKFSTEAKTKRHLANALARFNQVEGFSAEEKAKAWKKLLRLCKKYGIEVSDEKQPAKAATVIEGLVAKAMDNRKFPQEMRKGMFEVAWLARMIEDLGYLRQNARFEAEYEHDDSPLPAELQNNLEGLIDTFLSMATEETEELAAA